MQVSVGTLVDRIAAIDKMVDHALYTGNAEESHTLMELRDRALQDLGQRMYQMLASDASNLAPEAAEPDINDDPSVFAGGNFDEPYPTEDDPMRMVQETEEYIPGEPPF
jgi:hypothetical protein